MKSGFGLMQALFVIVLVGGLLAIAMKYARVSTKQTADIYVKEQAGMFLDSAVELSLLAISGYDRAANNNCLSRIEITSSDGRFKADVNITDYFLLTDSNDSSYCKNGGGYTVHDIQTEDSHGMVMLEIAAETNSSHPKNSGKNIRVLRRTLQRP